MQILDCARCAASVPSAGLADCADATQFGLLTTTGTGVTCRRNAGVMPWTFYLDMNLQPTFRLAVNPKPNTPQSLTANIRSSNVLNHLNATA